MSARSIVVTGIGAVTREEVLDAAQVRLGTPLLQINTDGIADRVAAIRRVASARVQREYPSALRITVVERVAVVVKDFPDGPHLFDRDGVDFATGAATAGVALYRRRQSRADRSDDQSRARGPDRAAPEVAAQVGRIAAPSVASITLTLARRPNGDLGDQRPHRGKGREVGGLLTQPGRTYDVSSPDLPTVNNAAPGRHPPPKIRPKFARCASARLRRSCAQHPYRSVCANQLDITLTLYLRLRFAGGFRQAVPPGRNTE